VNDVSPTGGRFAPKLKKSPDIEEMFADLIMSFEEVLEVIKGLKVSEGNMFEAILEHSRLNKEVLFRSMVVAAPEIVSCFDVLIRVDSLNSFVCSFMLTWVVLDSKCSGPGVLCVCIFVS
jgi:hypothetical protein